LVLGSGSILSADMPEIVAHSQALESAAGATGLPSLFEDGHCVSVLGAREPGRGEVRAGAPDTTQFMPVRSKRSLTICRQAPSITPLAIGYPQATYSSYRIRSRLFAKYWQMVSRLERFFPDSFWVPVRSRDGV
jgi:hypothetical protein